MFGAWLPIAPGRSSPPRSSNNHSETQILRIGLLEQTWLRGAASPSVGARSAFVQVGRQDAHSGDIVHNARLQEQRELQIYESWLIFSPKPTGVR